MYGNCLLTIYFVHVAHRVFDVLYPSNENNNLKNKLTNVHVGTLIVERKHFKTDFRT